LTCFEKSMLVPVAVSANDVRVAVDALVDDVPAAERPVAAALPALLPASTSVSTYFAAATDVAAPELAAPGPLLDRSAARASSHVFRHPVTVIASPPR
jgi:hypothetical protein